MTDELKQLAEEGLEWCQDWRDGMFTPAPTSDGWSVEMYGLVESHEQLCRAHIKALTVANAARELYDEWAAINNVERLPLPIQKIGEALKELDGEAVR